MIYGYVYITTNLINGRQYHKAKLAKIKWYYNPKTNESIKTEVCPEGFVPGRKFQITEDFINARKALTGSFIAHNPNTKETIRIRKNEEIPFGFLRGKGNK